MLKFTGLVNVIFRWSTRDVHLLGTERHKPWPALLQLSEEQFVHHMNAHEYACMSFVVEASAKVLHASFVQQEHRESALALHNGDLQITVT